MNRDGLNLLLAAVIRQAALDCYYPAARHRNLRTRDIIEAWRVIGPMPDHHRARLMHAVLARPSVVANDAKFNPRRAVFDQ